MLEEGFCAQCESPYDACLECENNQICKKCRNGYTLRDFILDDGTLRRQCVACPTNDGCDECSDNICKTCLKGYFLDPSDNRCYKCKAYLDGCEECQNSRRCDKCSDVGFITTTDGKCECNVA